MSLTLKRNICLTLSLLILTALPLAPRIYAQGKTSKPIAPVAIEKDGRGLGLGVKTLPASSKRYALVIGVEQYQDKQITPLTAASNDAKLLAESLVRYAGFPADQVILLASDQAAERQPTRENILRRLSNLRSVIPADGLLLVSFAGHGMERQGKAYLLPSNAQVNNDVDLLEDTAVSVDTVKERIRQTGVKQVMIILDACRNDPAAGRAEAPNLMTEAYTRGFSFDTRNQEVTAFATLYATSVGSRAYENTEKKNGYFTLALVEGLKGAAANDKGEVTLDSLREYVQTEVPKRVKLDLGGSKKQDPQVVIEGYKANELVVSITVNLPPGTNVKINTNASTSAEPAKPEIVTQANGLTLKSFSFKVITLRADQQVLKEKDGQAKVFTENLKDKAKLEMVQIPAGEFLMGSVQDERNSIHENELPQHKVNLPEFYLGKYEVTQAQWKVVASLPKINIDLKADPSEFKDDDLPVESITWDEAVEFCARLSQATGRQYRLPSEAEWEYACRAGTTTRFSFGSSISPRYTNYPEKGQVVGVKPEDYDRGQPLPVGSLNAPNAFGLYDMHGNVMEYCQDIWHENYQNAPTDGRAWLTEGAPETHLLRGGSWEVWPVVACSAYRLDAKLDWKRSDTGFRVAMTAPKK